VLSIEESKTQENAKIFDLRKLLFDNNNPTETQLNIILQVNNTKAVIKADNAECTEYLDEIQELPKSVAVTEYIKRLGLRKKDREIIFILEPSAFE